MNKNIVSIFAGHDANISFYNSETGTYHIIEIERITKQRYCNMHSMSAYQQKVILENCRDIAVKFWNFKKFDLVIIACDGSIDPALLSSIFKTKNFAHVKGHHACHALSSFYQSPYEESIVISYDGGGDDGFFNIFKASRKNHSLIPLTTIKSDFGGGYLVAGMLIKEVAEKGNPATFAGKLMGLCAYGEPINNIISPLVEFFFNKNYRKLKTELFNFLSSQNKYPNPWLGTDFEKEALGIEKYSNEPLNPKYDSSILDGQLSYDFAASIQRAFEVAFFLILSDFRKDFNENLPICLTGGCALNVLINEKLSLINEVFVPPNPSDCGLSLGAIFAITKPTKRIEVAYSGVPLLDSEDLLKYVQDRKAKKVSIEKVAKLIKSGKIIGIAHNNSEVGPRALGNRSIVCDPSHKNMKDILNNKIKFREWYRPFAPFCKLEDASEYFDSKAFNNMQSMSFAPYVKKEFREKLPSITHIDGTARLQTVTEKNHKFFYQLLDEFSKISNTKVLLNTSFNIKGQPILTTIEDALKVLDETELDYVLIENYLFSKEKSI